MIFHKANSDSDKEDILREHPEPKQAISNQFDFVMSAPVGQQQNENDFNNELFQFAVDESPRDPKPIEEPDNRMQPLAQSSGVVQKPSNLWEETDEDNDSSDGAFNQIGDLDNLEKNVSNM